MNRILICILLTSCGHKQQVIIDPVFLPYVQHFVMDGESQGKQIGIDDLIIEFSDLGGPSVAGNIENGRCVITAFKTPVILINNNAWTVANTYDKVFQNASETKREELLYHELGHCIFGRAHVFSTIVLPFLGMNETVATSIMYPTEPDTVSYEEFRSYYIQELFDLNGKPML